jgi:hypothetical protein
VRVRRLLVSNGKKWKLGMKSAAVMGGSLVRNKMKTKNKKPLTAHQKAVILMNREASRAVNRVKMLEQLYLETMKAKELVK